MLASHEIGSLAVPYQDALLTQIDRALGFDWVAGHAMSGSSHVAFCVPVAHLKAGAR